MTLPTITEPGKKSFWKRPEGKTGLIINAAIAASIFMGWGYIVPFVLAAAVNTLNLIVVSLIGAAILYVAFDKNFRRFIFYLYKSVMRWLTGKFVDIDPVGVLKTYIEKITEKKEELEGAVGEIRSQRVKLNKVLTKNKEVYGESLAKLQVAKDRLTNGDAEKQRQASRVIGLESKQVDRLSGIIKTQEGHAKQYDFIVQALTRYGEVCDDSITDMRNEVDVRIQEQEQARSFKKGMSAAFGILKGLPDDQEMYDIALDSLEKEYAENMGRVENVLDLTKNVILQADFNDEASLAKADALLKEWTTSHAVLPVTKEQAALPEAQSHIHITLPTAEKVKVRADRMFD